MWGYSVDRRSEEKERGTGGGDWTRTAFMVVGIVKLWTARLPRRRWIGSGSTPSPTAAKSTGRGFASSHSARVSVVRSHLGLIPPGSRGGHHDGGDAQPGIDHPRSRLLSAREFESGRLKLLR
jgi:hypothetical protein